MNLTKLLYKLRHIIFVIFAISVCKFSFSQNKKVDSLKLVLKNAKHDTIIAQTLFDIGKELERQKPDTAFSYYNKAQQFCEKNQNNYNTKSKEYVSIIVSLAKSINGIGVIYHDKNTIEKALKYYEMSIEICNKINYKLGLAKSYNNIGVIYRLQGKIQEGIKYALISIKLKEEIGDKKGIATTYITLGLESWRIGNISKAIEYYTNSLKTFEEIKHIDGIATNLNNLGLVYKDQGDFKKALEFFERAKKISIENSFDKGLANSLKEIGILYSEQNKISMAFENLNKSIEIFERLENKKGVAEVLYYLGNIYLQNDDTTKAIKNFDESYELCKNAGFKQGIAYALLGKGKVFQKENKISQSIDYFEKAKKLFNELGYPKDLKVVAENLNSIYRSLGNHQLALENYELFIKMRDSINNIETQKVAIKQNAKYEYEKQQAIAKADFDKQQALSKLELQNKQSLIEKNQQQVLLLEKENDLKELTLLQSASELKQKQILSENQQKQLELLDKEQKLSKIASEKQQADLQKQRLINYSLIAGVGLVLAILVVAIRGYQRKKRDNEVIQKQKTEVEEQRQSLATKNHIIEEKQKEILDSINYAKRIQYTLLAHEQFLKNNLNEHFIYFNPKDIVSGDFYWATKVVSSNGDEKFYLAVSDSTGHGIPGAFMSLLNIGFLSEAINEKGIEEPNEVFNFVRERLISTISKDGQKDGFDGILVCFSKEKITYAAANNEPILIRNNEIIELPKDRMPVGKGEKQDSFTLYQIEANSGDTLYLYTDGYADQFGGPKGKKFKYKPLNELLLTNANLPLSEQHELIKSTFNEWKGELEQVDDVCVVGVRI
jgi:serine phosphatase RsbU (regulator of sigma subunit)